MTTLLCSAAFCSAAGLLAPSLACADGVAGSGQLPPVPLNFTDPGAPAPIGVGFGQARNERFLPLGRQETQAGDDAGNYQLQVTADGGSVGVPLNLSIAQHGNFEADDTGDLARRGRGAELRLGSRPAQPAGSNSKPTPGWYVFAASDNQALTWNPGVRNAFGGRGATLSLQDRVEIGDHQAGVTYETGSGVQASLAYVERDVSAHVANRSYSRDESFAGVTVTMRH